MAKRKSLGILRALITADAREFRRGMGAARRSLGRFVSSIRSGLGWLLKWGAALTGGISIAAITLLIKKQLGYVDATAKLADSLGITTEALQKLRYVSSITGVEQEGLDKSMEAFARRLGDAMGGTGEYKEALDKLGLSAKDLAAIPLDEAFLKVGDKIRGLSTGVEQADIAYQLFGRQGIKLLNVLRISRAEFEALAAEAVKSGIAFNRIDAAKIEMANDAMTKLKQAFNGLIQQITIQLAPSIRKVADELWSLGQDGRLASSRIKLAFADMVGFVSTAVDALTTHLRIIVHGFTAELYEALAALKIVFSPSALIFGKDAKGDINRLLDTAELLRKEMEELVNIDTFGQRFSKWWKTIQADANRAAKDIARAKREMGGLAKIAGVTEVPGLTPAMLRGSREARVVEFRHQERSIGLLQQMVQKQTQAVTWLQRLQQTLRTIFPNIRGVGIGTP